MSDLALSVRGLSKSYTIAHQATPKESTLAETVLQRLKRPFARSTKETFWALKDVSFDVKKGEVVGIIGRNGAGKSTLLKVLSRITEPTEGQIDLFGRVGSLLEVGTGFHPELTGRENVFLNGAILGMTRAEIRKQFDAIVDFAGVEKFLDTPVKRYSSGMYVRLAFAVAAHLRSEILIVDEVLAVGDAEFQKKCLGKMQDVAHDGRTVLFVSHNMAAVESITATCAMLSKGRLVRVGRTGELVAEYLSGDNALGADLDAFRDRPSEGPHRIVSIRTANAGGELTYSFKPRETIKLLIELDAPVASTFDVAFAIEDDRGTALFASHESDRRKLMKRAGHLNYEIEIDPVYLRHGRYLISMGVYSSDIMTRYDEVLHYPVFSIEGHTDGFPQDGRWGAMYFDIAWEARQE
jgi:lipopolysaccharide transport system ATP-binding protein